MTTTSHGEFVCTRPSFEKRRKPIPASQQSKRADRTNRQGELYQPFVGMLSKTRRMTSWLAEFAKSACCYLLLWILFAIEWPLRYQVLLLRKENYKVKANIGLSTSSLWRHVAVLDTGAGPNCVNRDSLPPGWQRRLRPVPGYSVYDASGGTLKILGVVTLAVEVGRCRVKAEFIVCDRFQVPFILGTDFTDRFVTGIFPKDKYVEMEDGSTTPIIQAFRGPELPTRVEDGREKLTKERDQPRSNRIRVSRPVRLSPNSQTWVEVVCERRGQLVIVPRPALLPRMGIAVANGIADVQPGRPFRVLVSNVRDVPCMLHKGTVVAHAEDHPKWVAESALVTGEVLGITSAPAASGITAVAEADAPADGKPTGETLVDELDLSYFPEKLHEEARAILRKHSHMWDGQLGQINTTEHRLELEPGTVPIRQPPYRAGHKEREFETAEVGKMLELGIIRPSKSEWASPVVLAPKGDGSLRFCIDYRRLNAVTKRDSYPLPRMDDCIDSLGDAKFFSTLDANSGYWQVPMRESDIEKTAFVTHDGLYEFRRMPFGLKNAPATFQRVLDLILAGFKWQTCLVYIDDVVIFSGSAEQHLEDVDTILTELGKAGITLRFDKCLFFTDHVRYLGHIVRPGTLEVDQSHVKSLLEAEPPKTVSELRSFLGFVNVYRRFIRNYTQLAKPLYGLLKGAPKELPPLGDDAISAFRALINAVTSPPILAIPKKGLRYSLDTDASNYQVGCALFQTHPDGVRRPIGFWSRKMNDAEMNYSASERECLAVIYGITTCRPYLVGEEFDLHTDHSCLRWLMEINDPSGRLMRWRLRLAEYTFSIHHKKGYLNTQADAVSRLPSKGHTTEHEDYEVPCLLTSPNDGQLPEQIATQELLSEQIKDEFCASVRSRLEEGVRLEFEDNPQTGVLERILPTHRAAVIPKSLQARLLNAEHYPVCAGHEGGRRMYTSLRRRYYWPRMAVDCYETVAACRKCSEERILLQKKASKLMPFPANAPLEDIAMDLLGPLQKTPRGNKYLLVIVDRFTKLVRAVPMGDTKAWDLAKAFTRHWVFVYGPPKTVLTDKGTNFTSKFMLEVHRSLGIRSRMTTAYHPQTNGQTERFNRTIVSAMRKFVADHPKDWDLYTDALTFSYNCHVHTSTGVAPFELTLSRTPPLLGLEDASTPDGLTPREARLAWLRKLTRVVAQARAGLEKAQARMKRNFDRQLRQRKKAISTGSWVNVKREAPASKKATKAERAAGDTTASFHKLSSRAEGPYRVLRVKPNTVVIDRGDVHEEVNKDRLELARPPPDAEETAQDEQQRDVSEEEGDGEEYVIDRLTGHQTDEDGTTRYWVKWYGFEEKTLEPTKNLPYSAIARYWRKRKKPVPADATQARQG